MTAWTARARVPIRGVLLTLTEWRCKQVATVRVARSVHRHATNDKSRRGRFWWREGGGGGPAQRRGPHCVLSALSSGGSSAGIVGSLSIEVTAAMETAASLFSGGSSAVLDTS